jgi:hypothetical protein
MGSRSGFGIGHRGGFGFRGGIAFGHNPRFGVFLNQRPFHHRRFFGPVFAYPYQPVYPYYPLGYQSDFVYTGTPPGQAAYMQDQNAGLQSDVYRLQAELDQIRQEQASRAVQQQYVTASSRSAKPEAAPPTVLVFRDGHKVEAQNYAVAGQTLWIFSEQRARKVPLADLDLESTRKANDERGVEFAVRGNPAP